MKTFYIILLFLFTAHLNAQSSVDIDIDDDGLIEVSNLETLNAMRYQLDGSGLRINADAEKLTTGCAAGGCKGYELTGDLDFLDATSYQNIANQKLWTSGAGWQPIGNAEHPFNSLFKTNNSSTPHTIFNLTINRGDEDNVGLFGRLGSSAEISGVGLLDVQVEGRHQVGGLVGENAGGRVINSYASGIVVGTGGTVGLIVGSNSGSITNSYADGEVSAKNNSVGGLVGVNRGHISNSYAIGRVIGDANNVGGLVGDNSQGVISNSYATGSVAGSEDIGGLVGLSNLGTLIKNYVSGKATGIRYVGGLIGMNIGGTVSYSYWDKTTSALSSDTGGVGLSASELQSASAQSEDLNKPFYQWDTAHWDFGTEDQYPILKYVAGNDAENPACGPEPSLPNCGSLLLGQHANLKHIVLLGNATLTPRFKPTQLNYHLNITPSIKQLQFIPIANNSNAVIDISKGGTTTEANLTSGTTSTAITLESNTEITITVSATNQRSAQYRLIVNYLPTISITGMPSGSLDEGRIVTLDASQSSDVETETLSYRWTQTVGKTLELANADQPTLAFQIPKDYVAHNAAATEIGLMLEVNDGNASAIRNLSIEVTKIDNGNIALGIPTLNILEWVAPEVDPSEDPDGVGSNLQYQWQSRVPDDNADWIDIDKATQQTHTPSILTTSGTEYRVRISYTDGQGYETTIDSQATPYEPEIVNLDSVRGQASEPNAPPTTQTTTATAESQLEFQCSTTDIDQDNDGLIEICDLEGLNAIRYQLNGTGYKASAEATTITTGCADGGCKGYELMTDLDFWDDASYSSTSNKIIWTTGAGWEPIGYYKNYSDKKLFNAIFEGNSHTISNLMINRPNTNSVGLFGYIKSDSGVTDIGLLNINIKGNDDVGGLAGTGDYVGGLVGYNRGSVTNSYATGSVAGTGDYVGGLVGRNRGSVTNSYATGTVTGNDWVGGLVGYNNEGDITNSYATGTVTGNDGVGGLVGVNSGYVTNSYATGAVTGTGYNTGGLVGLNGGSVTNSYATGTVTGDWFVGGLVGWNSSSHISNSYATGAVSGNSDVGGLVGWNFSGRVTNSYATGTVAGNHRVGGLVGFNSSGRITNSYATGAVTGTGNYAGGLVGLNNGDITNSYATGTVAGNHRVGGLVGFNSSGRITNSYATGAVTGTGNYAGGLVGLNNGDITNSYWDTQTSGLATSAGGEGKATAELQSPTMATGIYRNWETANWDFGTSSQYPTIKYAAGSDTDNPACGIAGQPICGKILPNQYPNLLDNLAVSNGTLSPQFNPQTYIYDVVVNYDVEQLELHTTATDATIRITSNTSSREYIATNSTSTVLPLKLTADTVITIEVMKDNRPTTSYILTVTYESNDNISLPSPTVTVTPKASMEGTTLEGTTVKLKATLAEGYSCGTELKCEWSYIDASSSATEVSSELNFMIPADYVAADQSTQQLIVIFAMGNAGGVAREQVTFIVKKTNNGSIRMEKPTLGHRSLTAPEIDLLNDPEGVSTGIITYQWQRTIADNLDLGKSASWEDIKRATAKSYTVPESVAYSPSYRVLINYTDGQGYNTTSISSWIRDIDVDDDGLIEIRYLDELHAIRYQLDGSGYKASAEATKITIGCAISGCKGYELTRYLDFWDDASYSSTSNKIIWTTGEGWEPIGYYKNPNDNKPFTAIFKGNSHTISNLMINRSDTSYVGFFSYTNRSSTVTDIGLLNINIQGASEVGGLVGRNQGSVTNSYATGAVTGNWEVGGLVGENRGSITNSYATGTVTGGSVGGLVGYNRGRITNSYATGTVTGNSEVGGLVGENDGRITNSYATGAVTGDSGVGGLVGVNNSGYITNSYATGAVIGNSQVGGLVGSNNRGSVTNSYWNTQTSGLATSAGGEGKATAELQLPTTTTGIYSHWSTANWDFGTSSQYPILKKSDGTLLSPTLRYGLSQLRLAKGHLSPDFINIIPNYTGSVVVDTNTIQLIPIAINANARIHITGRGTQEIVSGATSDDIMLNEDGITTITIVVMTTGISIEYNFNLRYYQYSGDVDRDNDGLIEIDNIEDLSAIRYQFDGTGYRKERTVPKITTGCPSTGCKGYELTKNLSFAEDSDWSPIALFSGIFEGNGYTISKLTINKLNANSVGFFSSITSGAKINNISLLDIDIQGNRWVGGLVGYNYGSVTNSYATGTVTGDSWVVGGLVGENNGRVTNSYAISSVAGREDIGGLVGSNGGGSITNSYATGAVTGTGDNVGGLVGFNSSGRITNSYATGAVTGTGNYAGGLVGLNNGDITNSYWDTQTSGLATSAGGEGKATAELQSPTMATGIYRNWETANWDFGTSSQYPTIKYAAGADTDNPACGIAGQPICGEVLPNQLSLLDNLAVSNGTLSPQFNPQTYIYDVVVNYDVEQLELHTTATDATIRITSNTSSREYIATNGTSTVLPLKLTADTVITIKVMKDNRRTISYILTVTYASNDDTPKPPSPTVTVTPEESMEGTTLEGTTVKLEATLAGSCGTELKCELSYMDVSSSVTEVPLELNFMIPADYVAADQSTQQLIVIFAVGNAGGVAREQVTLIVKKTNNGSIRMNEPTLGHRSLTAPEVDDPEGVLTDSIIIYQWQRTIADNLDLSKSASWENITGATTQSYTVPESVAYSPSYRVLINYTDGQGYNSTGISSWIRDIDVDDDGLIEIKYLDELHAIRYQLDGSGYKASAEATKITTGCAISDCKGYELTRYLDFWDDASYSSTSNKIIWTTGEGWEPIGYYKDNNDNKPFTAIFEGNSHTISNLMINRSDTSYVGFFGYTNSSSTVTDIGLLNINIQGADSVGGLVGSNNGSITNSYATGTVTGNYRVGGLVGSNNGNGSVMSSYVTGTVIGTGVHVGGLVGYNNGDITNSYAMGAVTGDRFVGGLVGENGGSITNSYATGAVTGNSNVGGLVGSNRGSVTNSHWNTQTSGLATSAGGDGVTSATTAQLQSPTAPGTTTTQVYYGWSSDDWDFGTSSQYPILKKSDGTLLSSTLRYGLSQLRLAKGHLSPDFISIIPSYTGSVVVDTNTIQLIPIAIDANARISITGGATNKQEIASGATSDDIMLNEDGITTITIVVMTTGISIEYNFNLRYYQYSGDVDIDNDGLIEINNIEGLNAIRYQPDGTGYRQEVTVPKITTGCPSTGCKGYELTQNLSFAEDSDWSPIALFSGIFEGNGYTISNLTIKKPNANYVGLFSSITSGAKINNIGLLDIDIQGDSRVGGLVGYNVGDITNSYATGSVTRTSNSVGGLVGENYGRITNSYATGSVAGTADVGGLAGLNYGDITNSYATGSVTGTSNSVGGLVGYNDGDITNSYATGSVAGTGNSVVGGLVGYNDGDITNSYATGSVAGTGNSVVGGLVGYNDAGGSVTNSYWDTHTSGLATSAGGDGVTSATTAQLQSPTAPGTMTTEVYYGWSSDDWDFGTSLQYPVLKYATNCDVLEQPACDTPLPGQYLNLLAKLELSDGTLSPAFDSYVFRYDVEVGLDVDYIKITAATTDTDAYLSISSDIMGSIISDQQHSVNDVSVDLTRTGVAVITIEVVQRNRRTTSYILTVTYESRDIDVDDDGLIEIRYLDELHAIRYQLDGSGYKASADVDEITTGCAVGGCKGYELTRDLDFDDDASYLDTANRTRWTTGEGWEPIGINDSFSGILQGNGHTISNLMINSPEADYVGLFFMLSESAVIDSIDLSKVDIRGKDHVGGLVGSNAGGTIRAINIDRVDSTIPNRVIGTGNNVGGLVGSNAGGTIRAINIGRVDSTIPNRVIGTGNNVGGLVGSNTENGIIEGVDIYGVEIEGSSQVGGLVGKNIRGMIINSSLSGNNNTTANSITATGAKIGGLVGYSLGGYIINSYAVTNIRGATSGRTNGSRIGGLIGQNKSWIISSYAAGSIEANKHIGGLVGWNIRNIINSYARVKTNRNFGSLIGSNKSDDVVIQSSYWNSDVNGNNITGDDQGIAKTTADLQSPTTATGIYGEWSTANWDFGTQNQYPALKYTGHCLGEDVPAYCNDNDLSTTHLVFLQSLCTGKGASDNCGTLLPGQRFGLQSLGLSDNAILIGDFNNEIYSYEILIGNETTSTGIIPVAADLNAEIELIEGDGSGAINLIGGELHLIELASNSTLTITIVVADERSEVSYRLRIVRLVPTIGIVRLVPTIDIEKTVFEEGDNVSLVAEIAPQNLPSVYEYTYQWSGDLLATMSTENNIQSKISETYVLRPDAERIANIELTVNFMSEGKQISSYATKSLRIMKKDNGSISNIGALTVSTQTWTLTVPMLPTNVDDGGDPEGIQDGSLSYLWESRKSARAEWQAVGGATSKTYQIAETIPAYTEYRVRIGYTDNQLHPIDSSATDAPTSLPYTYKVVDRDSNGLINIYTAEQLDAIRYQLDGSSYHPSATTDSMSSLGCSGNNCSGYELKAHIDLNGFNDWQPIGNAGDPFNTTFEGNNYTIYNLTIDSTATNSAGLFGVTSLDAKLHDIKLLNVNINAGNYVGGLVGHNQGMISDSYVVGRVIGNQNVGGLVGMHGQQNNSTNTMIINSHAIVIVGDEGSSNVGGLVGHNYAKIKHSYVIARQLKGSSNVGGLIGLNHDDLNDNDDVENNYATVDSLTEDGIADSCKIVGGGKNINKSLIIGGCQSTSLFE